MLTIPVVPAEANRPALEDAGQFQADGRCCTKAEADLDLAPQCLTGKELEVEKQNANLGNPNGRNIDLLQGREELESLCNVTKG